MEQQKRILKACHPFSPPCELLNWTLGEWVSGERLLLGVLQATTTANSGNGKQVSQAGELRCVGSLTFDQALKLVQGRCVAAAVAALVLSRKVLQRCGAFRCFECKEWRRI